MDSGPEQFDAAQEVTTPEPTGIFLEPSVPATPEPTAAFYRRQFFFGVFGLRAVWSLLIYFAIVFSIILGIRGLQAVGKAHHDHAAAVSKSATAGSAVTKPAPAPAEKKPDAGTPQPMGQMIAVEGISFAVLFLLSWLMAVIEHRRVSAFGLGGKQFLSRFLVGAFWGLLAQSLLILALYSFHFLHFDAHLLHGLAIFRWGLIQLFAFLLVGLVEEYLFRGYLQFTLYRGMVSIGNLFSPERARSIAFWIAAFLTSAFFLYAHTHNPGENKLGLFQVFLAGMLFIVALWRTGSLWWAIGFHMAWDWTQSFLFGVPDSGGLMQGRLFATHASGNPLYSGGTVGPEGSLLCVPILILSIVVVLFTHPSPQPPLETLPPKLPPSPEPYTLIA